MRTISLSAKCSDMFSAVYTSAAGEKEYDGYVPEQIGVGDGDYVNFTIDIDTGKIVGWEIPTEEKLAEIFK